MRLLDSSRLGAQQAALVPYSWNTAKYVEGRASVIEANFGDYSLTCSEFELLGRERVVKRHSRLNCSSASRETIWTRVPTGKRS